MQGNSSFEKIRKGNKPGRNRNSFEDRQQADKKHQKMKRRKARQSKGIY